MSAKDQSRLHEIGKKVSPGIFLGMHRMRGELGRDKFLVADTEELGNFGRVRNPGSKTQFEEDFQAVKR